MENEDLALAIKNGDRSKCLELWENVKKRITGKAYARMRCVPESMRHGIDVEDLIQAGYLAMERAVRYYNPEKGYPFQSYLEYTCRVEFNLLFLRKTSKRDAIFFSDSADVPLGDDPEGESVLDGMEYPEDGSPFEGIEAADKRLTQKQIREAMDAVAADLLDDEQRRVYQSLLRDESMIDLAEESGISASGVRLRKKKVLEVLSRDPRIMQLYLEAEESKMTVEDISALGLRNVSSNAFKNDGMSSVERLVLRLLDDPRTWSKRTQLREAVGRRLHADWIARSRAKYEKSV